MKYYSQYKQDRLINFLFNGKKNGIFLDIGANDGIFLSNSYFFEKEKAWTGLCVEPNPDIYQKLINFRICFTENCCISDKEEDLIFRKVSGDLSLLSGIINFFYDGHLQRIENERAITGDTYEDIVVKGKKINSLLEKNNLTNIDYCSIDTEGAEMIILKSIDFEKVNILAFSVENNTKDDSAKNYLETKGYKCFKSVNDDFFVKNGTKRIKLFSIYLWFIVLKWNKFGLIRAKKFLLRLIKN